MATKLEAVVNEPVSGTKVNRYARATVTNPIKEPTTVRYDTETLIELDDGTRINQATEPITVVLVDRQVKYAVLDHETGLPTGASMSDAELADAIYSRYVYSVENAG